MIDHLYANLLDMLTNNVDWETDWNANVGVLKDALRTLKMTTTVVGSHTSPSTVTIQLQDAVGNNIAEIFLLRVRVVDNNMYLPATNATIAIGGGTGAIETITAGKDLIVQSDAGGLVTIVCTDATIEYFQLLLGQPKVLSHAGIVNYNNLLLLHHA